MHTIPVVYMPTTVFYRTAFRTICTHPAAFRWRLQGAAELTPAGADQISPPQPLLFLIRVIYRYPGIESYTDTARILYGIHQYE